MGPVDAAPLLEQVLPPPPPTKSAEESNGVPVAECASEGHELSVEDDIELAPGSAELPSTGSAGHNAGTCRPCIFVHTNRCESGINCTFCHLCEKGERKRRKKAGKLAVDRMAMQTSPVAQSSPDLSPA